MISFREFGSNLFMVSIDNLSSIILPKRQFVIKYDIYSRIIEIVNKITRKTILMFDYSMVREPRSTSNSDLMKKLSKLIKTKDS